MLNQQKEIQRERGQYYTPIIWAKRADQLMHHNIDLACTHHDFHQDALIWDCACGTRNLTRSFHDYHDLYTSTIDVNELSMSNAYKSSHETSFQYNFLSDDVLMHPQDHIEYDSKLYKMPKSLYMDLLSHSKFLVRLWNYGHSHSITFNPNPVVFYTNPPYGTAGEGKRLTAKGKSGLGKDTHHTTVNQLMIERHMGGATQQLYIQFYVRAITLIQAFHLKNAYICFFSTPQFLAGGHYWQKFNDLLFDNFKLQSGFMFNSGEFSGTREDWSIAFLIFKHCIGKSSQFQTLDVESSQYTQRANNTSLIFNPTHHLEIKSIGKHTFNRISSDEFLYKWAHYNDFFVDSSISKDQLIKMQHAPEMSTGVTINHGKHPRGLFKPYSLGYLVFSGDNVEDGINGVWLTSATAYGANGFNVMPTRECVSRIAIAYASRKVVDRNWIDSKDNFRFPNVNKSGYQRFVNDALIYSLFSSGSNQSSLRIKGFSNVNRDGVWANKWFWMKPLQIVKALHKSRNRALINDYHTYHCASYICNLMHRLNIDQNISAPAEDVLKYANLVWLQSLKYRQVYTKLQRKYGTKKYPKLFINTWDAGWYQIKLLVLNKGIRHYVSADSSVSTDEHGILSSYDLFNDSLKKLTKLLRHDVFAFGLLGKAYTKRHHESTGIQGSLF